jgi:hypothetical protein
MREEVALPEKRIGQAASSLQEAHEFRLARRNNIMKAARDAQYLEFWPAVNPIFSVPFRSLLPWKIDRLRSGIVRVHGSKMGRALPMARQSTKPPRPFGRWQLTIEKAQYRFRLPDEAAKIIPWLKAEVGFSVECQGFLGTYGQVQITPSAPSAEITARLNSEAATAAFDPKATLTDLTQLIRFAATIWPLRFSFEQPTDHPAGKFRLYLRTEMADQGILPQCGEELVIFAAASVVELWKPAEWLQNVKAVRADLERTIGSAARELEELL